MKKLLLIMGDLAAGKSTFARRLSERYRVNVFCKDSIKEVLGDTVGFANRAENKKLSNAAVELMRFMFAEFARLDKDLILESNFHTGELELLHKLAQDNGYGVLSVVLRGDTQLLYGRYMNRMENENRHPVHLSTTLDVFEDFKAHAEASRKEYIPGEVLTVCADDYSYQSDKAVLENIDAFMAE